MSNPTPEQIAAAVERLTRFYVIGKLEQVEVHGLPMGLGDSTIIVLQALAAYERDIEGYIQELEHYESLMPVPETTDEYLRRTREVEALKRRAAVRTPMVDLRPPTDPALEIEAQP